ncbi:MAG: ankyrin repeat domain-containing protein [Leptospiraceae bacterium]|nr:ankyrin repeat domain-containing protein [Leptospiraceae bacterium]
MTLQKARLHITLIALLLAVSPVFARINNFSDAVLYNDQASIEHFLKQGADINQVVSQGMTALMYYAENRNYKMMQFLIQRGAKVDQTTRLGNTALMKAMGISSEVIEQHTTPADKYRMAVLLVNAGADVSKTNQHDWTALHDALLGKTDLQLITYLVSKGALVNQKDQSGRTPLFLAATRLHPDIVAYLIQQGAAVQTRTSDGDTAFLETIAFLSNNGYNQKIHSNYAASLQILDMLVKAGADLNASNKQGQHHFHKIITFNAPLILHLVEMGADVNLKDNDGNTVLALVEKNYRDGYIKEPEYKKIKTILLSAGARPVALANNQDQYLFGAITSGSLDRVKQTLAAGANINAYDSMGQTPLIAAIKAMNYPIAVYLLAHGADKNGQTRDGLPPLQAVQGLEYNLVSNYQTTKYFTLLLQSGSDVNAVDSQGRTALMYAAKTKDMDAIRLLLQHRADTGRTDKSGSCVLHYLDFYGTVSAAELLMRNGAQVNCRNDKGITPAMVAFNDNNLELLAYYLQNGAAVTLKNNSGESLVDMATRQKQTARFDKEFYEKAYTLITKAAE